MHDRSGKAGEGGMAQVEVSGLWFASGSYWSPTFQHFLPPCLGATLVSLLWGGP